ncbi:glucan endo-1,3-beta-glucosidase A1-like protein [Echria macrotheca]|uniref:Glucan endo-1,3-beta-glucosidase A1-like protein n=1 Tax=Echria macrotheca TaxID=438768 RepID=A0AAJ0FF67_9PEZI|nr:glucan endo-1,3-beta-glucosidase A1-like protein [Echria macrotheca]
MICRAFLVLGMLYVITPPEGFSKALFLDVFSSYEPNTQPSPEKWTFDTGTSYPNGPAHWGTAEIQTYTTSKTNILISDQGTLLILPVKNDTTTTTTTTTSQNTKRDDNNQNQGQEKWTSSRIQSHPSFDFLCPPTQKIRLESSIKLSSSPSQSQSGIWPAFWSLSSSFRTSPSSWPLTGEIDILESVNGLPAIYQTLHCGDPTAGPCNEPTGISHSIPLERDVFHVFAAEIDRTNEGGGWEDEKVVWYVDGAEVFRVDGGMVGDEQAWTAMARSKRFLLLNVAVGGAFPDAVARGATPTTETEGGRGAGMEVGYVAVWGM